VLFKSFFLFSCTIFVAVAAFCQDSTKHTIDIMHAGLVSRPVQQFSLPEQSTMARQPICVLSADYYVTRLGFFCKEEINFEKATKIPFKFRLGSVAECDWLEGKTCR
jgi:hypothetical protein